jgi:C4-type Zn-finger protein
MAKASVHIRFTDSHLTCPQCAGMTWLPVGLVEVYVGAKKLTSRVVSCDNCGYRRLRPTVPDGATSESPDL